MMEKLIVRSLLSGMELGVNDVKDVMIVSDTSY